MSAEREFRADYASIADLQPKLVGNEVHLSGGRVFSDIFKCVAKDLKANGSLVLRFMAMKEGEDMYFPWEEGGQKHLLRVTRESSSQLGSVVTANVYCMVPQPGANVINPSEQELASEQQWKAVKMVDRTLCTVLFGEYKTCVRAVKNAKADWAKQWHDQAILEVKGKVAQLHLDQQRQAALTLALASFKQLKSVSVKRLKDELQRVLDAIDEAAAMPVVNSTGTVGNSSSDATAGLSPCKRARVPAATAQSAASAVAKKPRMQGALFDSQEAEAEEHRGQMEGEAAAVTEESDEQGSEATESEAEEEQQQQVEQGKEAEEEEGGEELDKDQQPIDAAQAAKPSVEADPPASEQLQTPPIAPIKRPVVGVAPSPAPSHSEIQAMTRAAASTVEGRALWQADMEELLNRGKGASDTEDTDMYEADTTQQGADTAAGICHDSPARKTTHDGSASSASDATGVEAATAATDINTNDDVDSSNNSDSHTNSYDGSTDAMSSAPTTAASASVDTTTNDNNNSAKEVATATAAPSSTAQTTTTNATLPLSPTPLLAAPNPPEGVASTMPMPRAAPPAATAVEATPTSLSPPQHAAATTGTTPSTTAEAIAGTTAAQLASPLRTQPVRKCRNEPIVEEGEEEQEARKQANKAAAKQTPKRQTTAVAAAEDDQEAPAPAPPSPSPPSHGHVDVDGVTIQGARVRVDRDKPRLARNVLDSMGLVVTHDPAIGATPQSVVDAAGRLPSLFGVDIFGQVVRDRAGKVVRIKSGDQRGAAKLERQGTRRKQLYMHPVAKRESLDNLVQAHCQGLSTEAEQQQVKQQAQAVTHLMDQQLQPAATSLAHDVLGAKYTAQKGVIIANETRGGMTCEDQASHHDTSNPDDAIIIFALAPMCLLVWPRSHHAVQAELEMEEMSEEDERRFTELLSTLPGKIPRWRLWLEAGDIVIMRGTTVHAGAAGFPGQPSPRAHFYIEGKKAKKQAAEQDTHVTAVMCMHSQLENVS